MSIVTSPSFPGHILLGIVSLPLLGVCLSGAEGLGGQADTTGVDTPAARAAYTDPTWKLAWADEFDQPGQPDAQHWTYEHGLIRNGEAQFYTVNRPENARVADGNLIITARKEAWEKVGYTSASLTTEGRFAFTGGKVEIRAQIPAGRGTWPALWTLGSDLGDHGWPGCGEIDLMEYVGMQPDRLHFTVHTQAFNHTKGTQRGTHITCPSPWVGFHRYGLVWTSQQLTWYFDDRPVFAYANDGQGHDHWPFDRPQFILINLAIGGGWGGQKGIDDAIFPAEFRIDYVRVWQRPGN
jgi:beta-glucanase (GH16 family)